MMMFFSKTITTFLFLIGVPLVCQCSQTSEAADKMFSRELKNMTYKQKFSSVFRGEKTLQWLTQDPAPNELTDQDCIFLKYLIKSIIDPRSTTGDEETLKSLYAQFKILENIAQRSTYDQTLATIAIAEGTSTSGVSLRLPFGGLIGNDVLSKSLTQNLKHYGHEVPPTFQQKTKNFIRNQTGRIFIVDRDGEIYGGSGLLLNRGDHPVIMTCKHNFKDPTGASFYFIPTKNLNPATGYPEIPGINKESLKAFLKTDPEVLKIDFNKMFNADEQPIPQTALEAAGFQDELVFCACSNSVPTLVGEIQGFTIGREALGQQHYAIGYPHMKIYTSLSPEEYRENTDRWLKGLESPLVVTSTQYKEATIKTGYRIKEAKQYEKDHKNAYDYNRTPSEGVALRHNKTLQHPVPTAPGMSGGPVFYLDERNETINVIGVVGGGMEQDIDQGLILTFN